MNTTGPALSTLSSQPVLELRDVAVPGRQHPRLADIALKLEAGERVALLGPSGAGKSTLLAVANGLLEPAQGEVRWDGISRARGQRARRRQQARIGTLWQDLRLIEELSVQQNLNCGRLAHWGWPRALLNLLLPMESEACAQALRQVDLEPHLLNQPVGELSGGQGQRVAIARSLVNDPYFILADEATGNLDSKTTAEILALFDELNNEGRTIIMVTHEDEVAGRSKRVVRLRDGLLQSDVQNDPEHRRQVAARALELIPQDVPVTKQPVTEQQVEA